MIFEFALYVFLLFIGGSFILFLYWTYALLHTMRGFYKKSVHAKNDIYGYRFFCKMDRTIPSRREIGRGSSLKVSLVFIRASLFMFSIESHLQGNVFTQITESEPKDLCAFASLVYFVLICSGSFVDIKTSHSGGLNLLLANPFSSQTNCLSGRLKKAL